VSNQPVTRRDPARKPLSPPQIRALRWVAEGLVFYKPWFATLYGCRVDTFEVLERRALVEVLDEPVNPTDRRMSQRHAVRLTDAGRMALECAPDVGPEPKPGRRRRRQ
jgi:hypothetical protein